MAKKNIVHFEKETPKGRKLQTSRLKKKLSTDGKLESDSEFFTRLSAYKYGTDGLDKADAHFNGDRSEYHVGKATGCRLCGSGRSAAVEVLAQQGELVGDPSKDATVKLTLVITGEEAKKLALAAPGGSYRISAPKADNAAKSLAGAASSQLISKRKMDRSRTDAKKKEAANSSPSKDSQVDQSKQAKEAPTSATPTTAKGG